jgi:hypothetical protein
VPPHLLIPLQHPKGTRYPVRCGDLRYGRGKWGERGTFILSASRGYPPFESLRRVMAWGEEWPCRHIGFHLFDILGVRRGNREREQNLVTLSFSRNILPEPLISFLFHPFITLSPSTSRLPDRAGHPSLH